MFYVHNNEGTRYDATREVLERRLKVYQLQDKPKARKYVEKEEDRSFYDKSKSHPPATQAAASKAYQNTMDLDYETEDICHAYQVMNKPVKTLELGMPIAKAWEMFKNFNIRHMPVLDSKGKIVGIVSDRDLLKYILIQDSELKVDSNKLVEEVMISDVLTANLMTDIRRIAQILFEHRISAMPIVDDHNNLIGIVTRSDILHAVIHHNVLNVRA